MAANRRSVFRSLMIRPAQKGSRLQLNTSRKTTQPFPDFPAKQGSCGKERYSGANGANANQIDSGRRLRVFRRSLVADRKVDLSLKCERKATEHGTPHVESTVG